MIPAFTYLSDERNIGHSSDLDRDGAADALRAEHEKAILSDLQELHRRYLFSTGDRLIINSIHHWAIRGVVRWLETLSEHECPEVALLLHFTSQPEPFRYNPAERHYRDAFSAISVSRRRGHIHLYADSTILIDEYRKLTELDILLAPFPHCCFADHVARPSANQKLRVGYVGEARYHKGFQLLPYISDWFGRSDLADIVEFHIHSFIFDRTARFYRQAMAHFRCAANVTLYPDPFDIGEYEHFLGGCDIVVLPYLLIYYYRQSSGIFADAVGMGIPVVIPRGTWMAKEAKRFGLTAMAIPENPVSFARATYHLCVHIEAYREQARIAKELWRQLNTPAALVDMFEAW